MSQLDLFSGASDSVGEVNYADSIRQLNSSKSQVAKLQKYILVSLFHYIKFPPDRIRLNVGSAWESDETHIRHVSLCGMNDEEVTFRCEAPPPWLPFKPGLIDTNMRAYASKCLAKFASPSEMETYKRQLRDRHFYYWGAEDASEALEYFLDQVLRYFFGHPTDQMDLSENTDLPDDQQDQTPYQVAARKLGAYWGNINVEGFLYSVIDGTAESSNDSGEYSIMVDDTGICVGRRGECYVEPSRLMNGLGEINENVSWGTW